MCKLRITSFTMLTDGRRMGSPWLCFLNGPFVFLDHQGEQEHDIASYVSLDSHTSNGRGGPSSGPSSLERSFTRRF